MNKQQAMIEALSMVSSEANAMSQNNLGMDKKDEDKVKLALQRLAEELHYRCYRMNAKNRKL